MKKRIANLLFLSLLCVVAYGKKKEVVCQYPAFRYSTAAQLVPEQVRADKAGTTVVFRVEVRDQWRMASSAALRADGQVLPLVSGRVCRVSPDGEEWAAFSPDSTYIGVSWRSKTAPRHGKLELTFPPLPKECREFDFVEGAEDGGKDVLGIRMDGRQYPMLFQSAHPAAECLDRLPEFRQRMDRVTLTVKYLGGIPSEAATSEPSVHFWNQDALTNPQAVECETSESGDGFTVTMRQSVPFTAPLRHAGLLSFVPLFIPGDSVLVEVDVPSMMARRFIPGQENRPYMRFTGKYAQLMEGMIDIWNGGIPDTDPDIRDEEQSPLTYDGYLAAKWAKLEQYKHQADSLFADRPAVAELAHLFAETFFIRTQAYKAYFRSWWTRHGLSRAQADSLYVADGYAASAEAADPRAASLELFGDGLRAAYAVPNATLVLPYMRKNKVAGGQACEWLERRAYGSECLAGIAAMRPLTEAQLDSLLPPERPIVEALNEECKQVVASVDEPGHVNETPQAGPADLVPAIVSRYKGKVVYMDFWATWCGPCKQGIKAMRPAHALYKDKDVVFVYVTDHSSQADVLPGFIATMPGEHYILDSLNKLENPAINGIPRYHIFDREGKLVYDSTGFAPGKEKTFMEEIDKALAQ